MGSWTLNSWLGGALMVIGIGNAVAGEPGPQAAGALTPVSAFATLPRISDVRMSLDGNSVAWLDRGANPAQIVAFDLVNKKDRRVFTMPENFKLRDLEWADNDVLLYVASTTLEMKRDARIYYEVRRTFSADLTNGKTQMLMGDQPDFEFVTNARLIATHTTKPNTALLFTIHFNPGAGRQPTGSHISATAKDSGWVASLYEVDTRTGHSKRVDEGTQFADEWLVDADGSSVARSEWNQQWALRSHDFTIFAKHGSSWSPIYHRNDGYALSLDGLTADRKSIISVGMDRDGRSKLLAIPLDGGEPQVLFEDPQFAVTSVILDKWDRHPIAVTLDGPDAALHYIDPLLQQRNKMLQATFPGMTVEFLGHSPDNVKQLVATYSASKPPTYYVIDFVTHKADILGEAYPALATTKAGKVAKISYPARDGQLIPAYLTSPADAAADKPLPLVVLVHRGPEARDYFSFDYMAQFFASRGYRVLQPQFRGSAGFGEDFRRAGWHQWGGLMQDDVTDGVKSMVDRQLADAKRVCIVGEDYGGYAALAGAAFTPNLYKCAISINGMFDLPLLGKYAEKHYGELSSEVANSREKIGSTEDPQLADHSPNRHAAGITAAVLLLQSTDDDVVPVEQAEMMANTLRGNGKSVKLVKMQGGDHLLTTAETRAQAMSEIDVFLRANLSN